LADVRFADFILPIVRRRSLVFGITGVAVVAAVVIAFVWPQSWRANATVLPPERRMDNPLFVPGGFEALGASLRGVTLRHVATPTDIFVAILESRSVRDSLVQRFSLRDVYGVETDAAAIKRLQSNTAITTTPTGTIVVSAIAESPQAAADLTNAYLEELDRVNRSLAQREASGIREFIEAELDDARVRLTDAEERMRAFQERYGAIEITEQARAVITGAATLSAQILGAEVELRVLRRTRDATHPDVVQAKDYLDELKQQLATIEGVRDTTVVSVGDAPGIESAPTDGPSAKPEVFPPLSKIPELGLHFGRLYRTVKTEEAIVTLLTEQYHRARIEERRSLPTVRVLDAAVPPEKRYRPRRRIIVLIAAFGALLLSVSISYALEIRDRIRRDPVRYAGLHEIGRDLRKGFKT
jgi:uncharacterized protein involved in exopolysaccharide biosynthesis